jgi:hypothetical protein
MEKAIWGDIHDAFSRPVTPSDNVADYVHTQILAELFRHSGYDGIMYRSSLKKSGINVALFNLRHAIFVTSSLYKVQSVRFRFKKEPDHLKESEFSPEMSRWLKAQLGTPNNKSKKQSKR